MEGAFGGNSSSSSTSGASILAAAAMGKPSTSLDAIVVHAKDTKDTKVPNKDEKKKEEPTKKTKSKFSLFGMNKDKESSEEKAKKKEAIHRKNMAKGVGYSSYQQKGWDVKAYVAAQKEKDKQIGKIMRHELTLFYFAQFVNCINTHIQKC